MEEEADDEDLMARIATGDQAAFHRLARRHAPRALGLARRITRNAADAEEIVQEALLRVWINAPRWRPTATIGTWLYRVVVNLCLKQRRRISLVELEPGMDPVDPAPDATTRIDVDETAHRVAEAIAALPDRQRVALVLSYYEGLSNAEAAVMLETTVSGIEALLVRAKRTLRAKLAATENDGG
jgi:RNA polymerase sigma-70 factor (ECF subfamily)